QVVSGQQPADAVEQRALAGDVTQIEKVVHRLEVDLSGYGRVLQDRLDLRCEAQSAAVELIVQRLHPEGIAAEQQSAPPRVPQGESEDAVEARQEVVAVLLVEMHEHFGVTDRTEV